MNVPSVPSVPSERTQPTERQTERAERILSAAAGLLLRYGYKRVTVDDIAREAGIGKGSVYLHWKTKEALFGTVLLREALVVWRELLARIRSDPSEAQLHRVMRAMLVFTRQRPLARALFNRDADLLGKLAETGIAQRSGRMAASQEFVAFLRSLGLMRTDMALAAQAYAYSAVLAGFSLVDPLIEGEPSVSLEEKAEAMAETFRRAFEPDVPPSPEALREAVVPRVIEYLESTCAFYEQQVQERMLASAQE
jgi:AcrR family transcriptional regulator